MSQVARIALAFALAGVLLAPLAACTRAKPLPPATATLTAAQAATLPPVAAITTPGATVVSVGPAPATSIGGVALSPTATPVAPVASPAPLPTSPAAEPTSGSSTQYTVAYGDTLFGIAGRFGTTVQAIADANNLSATTLIRAGQTLTIPGAKAQQTGEYVVQAGDTLYSIAAKYGTTGNSIAAANQIVNPSLLRVGQRLVIPQSGEAAAPGEEKVHVVQPGETLYRIAMQYGKTVQEIAVANNLPSVNSIRVGQRLIIP